MEVVKLNRSAAWGSGGVAIYDWACQSVAVHEAEGSTRWGVWQSGGGIGQSNGGTAKLGRHWIDFWGVLGPVASG
jgi:hypothetical protein